MNDGHNKEGNSQKQGKTRCSLSAFLA